MVQASCCAGPSLKCEGRHPKGKAASGEGRVKKHVAEIKIDGHRLVVKSDEDEVYIRTVENYLNNKIEEVKENTKAASTLDLALLAALNITGEVIKTREMLDKVGKRTEELEELIDRSLQ